MLDHGRTRRRTGAAAPDLPPARAHAQGAGAVPHGAEGRVLSGVGVHRRDAAATPGSTSTAASGRSSPTRVAGRREFPDETFYVDGGPEALSKGGTFIGRHICVPLEGVAVQINAFNFPVWGMLEKLATSFLAGMPSIVKPATVTCYLTEVVARAIVESGIAARGQLPAHLWQRGRSARSSRQPGRRRVHRIGRDRADARSGRKAILEHNVRFNHGGRLAELLDARPRRGAGQRRSSTSS